MKKNVIVTWSSFVIPTCLFNLIVAAKTENPGNAWIIENKELRVEVQESSARMSVLHKNTGLLWQQENPSERFAADEKVRIWKTDTPPAIDGSSAEWKNKDTVWLPWTGDDGEKNLSGGALLMWDDTHLYLYIRIRDNQRAFGGESAKEWWEADSVEFWIDKVQVGLHLCPGKEAVVNAKGNPFPGSKIAVKLIDEDHLPGYAVEVSMPIEHFPVLENPESGTRIYFAMGMNDADPEPGQPVKRIAQGYYPGSWKHSAPDTFAIAVLTDQSGKAPPMTTENNRTGGSITGVVTDMRKGKDKNALTYSLKVTRGQTKPVNLDVELKLLDDDPAMDVTITCPDGNQTEVETFYHPAPLYPPNPEKYFMAMTDYCDGRYLPVDDKIFRNKRLNSYGGDMPWVTVTDGKQGMMTIAMTPADSCIQMQTRIKDEKQLGFPGFGWFSSRGVFGDIRVGRLVFYDKGAHVKACKIYRKIAKEQGLVRKLTTDAEDNPDVMKLMGAVNWWGAPGLSFVREAVAAGMNHGLINGRFSPPEMEDIKKSGWLVGEYDNYEDINDSPALGRAKAPVKDHAVVKEDGEFMTAWITRDKDMNPVHTYMKQCTAMMVKNAEAVIPEVLKTFPYNTRFLDVTTATSLKECYSPVHGVTRSEDMACRQNLLKYVSRDLGLVTGGEHGRFFGVPYLHYHEGMMGGAMYSWPAGYLRDVEKREEISERYLTYGINPANRAPLFELVFHDCVVDYWYWGACSDYLHQVMPELTDRKTAMNILYGTPPMMWAKSHGLRWQVPEERELMLTIYRNVCKLHEIIGPQEMVSHAFLSNDRMVQQSTFEDGTVSTVNFGTSPFTVTKQNGDKLILCENDFYVNGPEIEQWRITPPNGGSRQTYIRTGKYLFADSGTDSFDVPGVSSCGQVNMIMESPDRTRIILRAGSTLKLRVPEWNADVKGEWALILLDNQGEPDKHIPTGDNDTIQFSAPSDESASYLLLSGKEARIPDITIDRLVLSVNGKPVSADTPLAKDAELTATATIRNTGLARAWRFTVSLYLGGVQGIKIASKDIWSLKAGGEKTITTVIPAAKADGLRNITAVIQCNRTLSLCGDTTATAAFTGPCDPGLFSVRKSFKLQLPERDPAGMPVELPFNLIQADNQRADAYNFRIRFQNNVVIPAQFESAEPESSAGRLVFCIPKGIQIKNETEAEVLGNPEGSDITYPHTSHYDVREDGTEIDMETYSAQIINGVLSSVSIRRKDGSKLPVVSDIIASSAEIGWSGEAGKVESMTCLQNGPVRSIFSCDKILENSNRLTRTWFFYPDRIEIHSTCKPHVASLNRAHYINKATASNGGSKKVVMDGSGDFENFGLKENPSWYAIFSDQYRNACIALSECGGFTYWDSGSRLGQISLNHNGKGTEKRVYIWGEGASDDSFAREAAKAYKQGIVVK